MENRELKMENRELRIENGELKMKLSLFTTLAEQEWRIEKAV